MRGKASIVLVVGFLLVAAVAGLAVGGLLARGEDDDAAAPSGAGVATPTQTEDGASESTATPALGDLSVAADKTSARANERVTLSGVLAGADAGVAVLVQRQEDGAWADFPAQTTTGAGGSYSLDVQLGRSGDNVLRLVAPSAGAQSDSVTVSIG